MSAGSWADRLGTARRARIVGRDAELARLNELAAGGRARLAYVHGPAGSGKTLILEIKGEDSAQDQAKRRALDQWVQAVNAQGGFGTWAWDVVVGSAAGMQDVIAKHAPQ